MLFFLTSTEPSNSRYCNQEGEVIYKSVCPYRAKRRMAVISRALPDLKPTPEDRLWAERHFVPPPPPPSSSTELELEEEEEDNGPPTKRASFDSSHDHDFHWEDPVPSFADLQKVGGVETSEPQTDFMFAKVAEVEFHTISATKIRYRDREWTAGEFFKKEKSEGWGWYGGNRIFTGPDGKEYKWKMGSSVSELFLKDTDSKNDNGTHPRAHVPFLVARFCAPRDGILHDEKKSAPCLEIFPTGEHMVEIILITFVYIEEMRRQRERQRQWKTRGTVAKDNTEA